jgi:hypothetical protein
MACWNVIAVESQNELVTALGQKQTAAADGTVNIKRELSIADAYVFRKAFKAKKAADCLELISLQGMSGKPFENFITRQSQALEKTIGSLGQWSQESTDYCLRSHLHGKRPKLVRITPRGESYWVRCPSSLVHGK